MIQPLRRRRGFTLIEILCVMTLLVLVLMILAVMLRETMRVRQIQDAGFDRLLFSQALAEQFRIDVAGAESDEEEWNDFVANAATLILHMKNKDHIVYRWREGQLERQVFTGEESQHRRPVPIGKSPLALEFVHAGKERVVRLRLYPLHKEKRESGQALEFAAALAGDLR